MNQPGVHCAGNTETSKLIDYDGRNTTPSEKKILDAGIKIVGLRIRNFVKEIAKDPEGITRLKEAVRKIGNVKSERELEGETSSMQPNADTTTKTKVGYSPRSTTEETKDNLPAVSSERSANLETVSSDSMSLLDSSAKRLHNSLKGMLPESSDANFNPERKPDIHTVEVACHVAHEITNLMRLKLDVMKFAKTFQPKEKDVTE